MLKSKVKVDVRVCEFPPGTSEYHANLMWNS